MRAEVEKLRRCRDGASRIFAKQKDGQVMFYVYILQSINNPEHFYVGYTNNLKLRLDEHNSGYARHTNRYKPWKLRTYFAFDNQEKAESFELYLKGHAGRKFQKKHL